MYSLARLSLSSSAGAASVAARWITTGPSMQSRKGGGGRKLVVQYAGKREELPVADDFDAEAASTAEQGDGGAAEGEITVRRDMMDALGARFAHVSPEEELDLVLGTVPKINLDKDTGEAVFMPLLEQSALSSIGNGFGKTGGVLVEGQVIAEDSRGFHVDIGLKFPARILRERLPEWDRKVVTVGSLLNVTLMDAEKTAHLQGDSRHTSIHLAMANYVEHVGTAAGPATNTPKTVGRVSAADAEDAAADSHNTLLFKGLSEGEGEASDGASGDAEGGGGGGDAGDVKPASQ